MRDHGANKQLVSAFTAALPAADGGAIGDVLCAHCRQETRFDVFHPFNRLVGLNAADEQFWRPLKDAFPDYEIRLGLLLAGEYERRSWVSGLGYIMGSFERPWLGITPTCGLAFLRLGLNFLIEDERITHAYVLLDIVDLMRQAGFYPFRRMPGSPEQWPFPPCTAAATTSTHDDARGRTTLRIVREMLESLGSGTDLADHAAHTQHSSHWHENMNWYGPAGVGSSRGPRGFDDYHGALFIQAFPDRGFYDRDPNGPVDGPGDHVQIGDGHFAVVSGYPSMYGTHTGGGWLGLNPSSRHVDMRVADWYRTDENDQLIDNWVMIDIPHILLQAGLDILDDMRYLADPMLPRWPR